MTTTKGRARRSRKGWMSSVKHPARGGRRQTPLWQWILGIPVVVVLVAAIVLFAYVRYFNPRLGISVRTVRATVLSRVEKTLPGGRLDPSASYLLVRVDGKDVRLTDNLPEWKETAVGDTLEVQLSDPGDGTLQPLSWKRVAPAVPR